MKEVIVFFFLSINLLQVSAQSKDIDSLIEHLKNLNYKEAKRLAQANKQELLENEIFQLAHVLEIAGQQPFEFEEIPINSDPITKLVSNLKEGYYQLYTNPYSEKPFKLFNDAYLLSKEVGSEELEKFCLLSILEVYNFELSQSNEDVLGYLDKYKILISDPADEFHYRLNIVLFNLRDIFINIRIDESYFYEFDKLMNSFPKDHPFWPKYNSTKGVFLETKGDIDSAIKLHEKAISAIGEEPYLKYITFRSNIRLSEIYRNKNEFEKAINYINEADKNKDSADTTRANFYIHSYLSKNLFGQQNFKEAYEHLAIANDLKYKSDYEKNTLEIAHLNTLYQTQEKEIALLKEREKVQGQQNLLVTSVFIIIFVSIVYYLIQKNTRRKQLLAVQEKDIEKQKVATLLKEQELITIDAMIEGQEKERQRIANDLHDDLGGLMAAIGMHFDSLQNEENQKNNPLFDKTQLLINEAYNKIRAIAHAKNSGVIAKHGLLKSVIEMADKVSVANNLLISVNDHGLDNRLENSLELSLFRIIQELITNVIKHARATEVSIQLTNHGDLLNIVIEDNGVGFNTSQLTSRKNGMGIKSIDKRVEFLQGTMEIDSVLEKGTSVIINIPL